MKKNMMKLTLKIFVTALFVVFSSQVKASVIYASGLLTFNTFWSADTVIVNGELSINAGVTLSIDPGTKVIFQGHHKIIVYGRILAIGDEDSPITFTINDTTGFSNMSSNAGGWYGIRFTGNTSSDTSKFVFCNFSYGKANGTGDDANGGAIFLDEFSNILVSNCIFEKNASKTYGGAIYIRKSDGIIKENIFKENKSANGGGIFIFFGTTHIYNNIFNTNFASTAGGGMFCSDTTTSRIHGNLFQRNMGYLGGGIGCFYSSPEINNNTFVYNKATNGGAISCIFSSPVFYNTIMYYNTGSSTGNQVALLNPGCDPDFYYCNIQGGTTAFGGGGVSTYAGDYINNISAAPQFEDTNANNFLIKQTSPCMDAGTPDTAGLKLLPYDLSGNQRINMGRIDMGAYERQQVVSFCGTISENTSWNADTVKITCDITIDDDITLNIEPKVYIEFQGVYGIYVNGRILANGTEADSIIFTSKNQTNGWKGIIFENTALANDTSKFNYCSFSYAKNSSLQGGAISVINFSKIKIDHSFFSNNSALDGGAIFADSSDIQIKHTKFRNNSANNTNGKGGAIYCYNGADIYTLNCEFINNTAFSGGSIYSEITQSKFITSIFANNTSTNGAGIFCDSSDIKVINSIIVNNTAATEGGGLKIHKSNPDITNTTISHNSSDIGGAVLLSESSPVITNCILYYNTASDSGNQVYINDTLCVPEFQYCDVSGDTTDFAYAYVDTLVFAGIYLHNIDTIPAFMELPGGVGSGFSGINADWSLDGCSHLYNNGTTDTTGLHLPAYDFGGNTRIFGGRIDIGAYELITPHIISQPQTLTVCEGDSAVFTVEVESSTPVTYTWEYSNTFGAIWLPAPGATNSPEYIIPSATHTTIEHYYHCIISSNCIQNITSQYAILHVNTAPVLNSHPSNLTICQGQAASFSVTAEGSNITYQWQQQTAGGTTWANCTGPTATQATYQISNTPTALNGYKYHCVISGACPPALTSDSAVLTVKALPTILSQPSNQSNCQGFNASFSLIASGTNITYLWEESTDGGVSWDTASGTSNTNSYQITGITPSMSGYKYRCTISGDCTPSVTSNVVTLTVYSSPAITSQPVSTHVCVNSDTTISVTATGGNLSYQWERKLPSEQLWSNAPGPSAVSANYQINDAAMNLNGAWYRCKITNSCPPSDTTDSVQLFVHPLPNVYIGPDQSILLYGDPIVLDAGAGFSTYHWSTGVQTQTITIYGTTAGVGAHMYVVTVSNSYGCKSSDSIVITVVDNTGIGTSEDNSYYNIYPNPTSDELYIDFKEICNDCEIIITNAQGQTLDYNYLVLTNNQRVIDFRGHAKGVYILTLKLNETIYKHKILYY